jgi:Saxitoxin biosynthesis operon protein SxtJ
VRSSRIDRHAAPQQRQLVAFGWIMAAAFAALALFRAWRHGAGALAAAFTLLALLFATAATIDPRLLGPIYRWWMRLADALGWVNTRFLLILVFYLVVTPLGLVMRLARRSPLAGPRNARTYWTNPPENSYGDRHYEKQF